MQDFTMPAEMVTQPSMARLGDSAGFSDFSGCLARDVAGALRHRNHQPAPGFPPLFLGDVFGHNLGLRYFCRDHWVVCNPDVSLHPLSAHDIHRGDADTAGRNPEGKGTLKRQGMPDSRI